MSAQVTLTVMRGKPGNEEFVFGEPRTCLVGRTADCFIQMPADEEYLGISRHHCLLIIDPPQVQVRDVGSRNGTYINGEKIGQRSRLQTAEEAALQHWPEYVLKEGDEIRVGAVVIRVSIAEHAVCAGSVTGSSAGEEKASRGP